ncbi:hypothetical protein Tco_0828032 [Tanacetum coccineum]
MESSLAKPNTNDDMNIELNEEFLMKLRSNAYYGTFNEDVVFPLSLADDARQWWIDEGDGKSPLGKNLLRNFSVNSILYPAMAKMKCWRKVITRVLIHLNSYPDDEEWEESYYGSPPNTTIDSSLKPYLNAQEKDDIEKEDKRC